MTRRPPDRILINGEEATITLVWSEACEGEEALNRMGAAPWLREAVKDEDAGDD